MVIDNVETIRNHFKRLLEDEQFIVDKSGTKTIEIIGAQFIADQLSIFGTVNEDWNARELQWYRSMSRNVYDIPPPIPQVWKSVASTDGYINSNYGWCVWSQENGNQYDNVIAELRKNPESRRACMIYNRPSMWKDYSRNGMSDFMCTFATQHFIREDKLISVVNMRSNDAVFGYKGDYSWQREIHESLGSKLNVELGDIIWNAGSLHVYERHFDLVKNG